MGDFMGAIHKELPSKDFPVPASGVIRATVCTESGLLPTPECGNHITTQWFLSGTEPTEFCTIHSDKNATAVFIDRLQKEMYKSGFGYDDAYDTSPLTIPSDIFDGGGGTQTEDDAADGDADYNYLME